MIAYILAGGKGSRLEPWHAPKCLMPVNGVPILHRIIDHIAPHVERVVVCVGYRAEDVVMSLSTGTDGQSRHHGKLWMSNAGEDATMIERLLYAKPTERALVVYGDELADVDIKALVEYHEAREAALTFTAWRYVIPFGVVNDESGLIEQCRRVEVNIGFAIVEPKAWSAAKPSMDFSEFVNAVGWSDMQVDHYIHRGRRATINNPSDIAKAEEIWK